MIMKILCYLSGIPVDRAEQIKAEMKATPAFYKWAFVGLLIGPFLTLDGLSRVDAPWWTYTLVISVQISGVVALVLMNLTRKGIKW